jgi:hypothetical protein
MRRLHELAQQGIMDGLALTTYSLTGTSVDTAEGIGRAARKPLTDFCRRVRERKIEYDAVSI